ncbi:MAG: S49 family peptidase, partial [Treponema sp.]|nr:S49 family peptidase [Treponema sp.]
MKVWYALADEELDRFYMFREMESRVRADLPVKSIELILAAVHETWVEEGGPALYETRDGIAVIAINGTLTAKRHISDDLYGDTTSYTDIEDAIQHADKNPLVREIHYHINSPGGYWDGLDCCAEAVKTSKKPSTAFVYTSALSGGYYLASQADRILAVTKGSSVGSIGVAAEVFDRTGADGQKGIIRHVLTNRASGDKRPKPEEEAGRELIVDRLDQLYGIFENRVLDGRKHVRGFSAETIRSLAGRTVTAEQALELGLIDGIRSEESEEDATGMEEGMKLADYLAANPGGKEELALYAAEALGMIDKAAVETQVNKGIEAALAADRARIE